MEKVIYLLWRDTQVSPDTFAHHLRSEVAGQLQALGARGAVSYTHLTLPTTPYV